MLAGKFAAGGAVLALAAFGFNADKVRPVVNPPIRQENLDAHEDHAPASLLGQFRTSVSSWLWLRADLYLHNGVEMRPLSEEEMKRGVTAQNAAHDGHEEIHKENAVTVVPPKERDFRGVFGDVERAVASYKDMHDHSHNEPQQALPLYRLMTWLDPQFAQGWTTGAMIMARDRTPAGTAKAVKFLEEGWRANPESVDLPSQIGYTIASRKGDLRIAVQFLEKSRSLGTGRLETLQPAEAEALQTTYRWLAMCYRNLGDKLRERQVCTEGVHIFKDDQVLRRLLQSAQN